jgi:hypothetical protein
VNTSQRAIAWLQIKAPLLSGFLRQFKGYDNQLISLEYRVDNHRPRYGYAHPPLAAINALCTSKRPAIADDITAFAGLIPELATVTLAATADPTAPFWENGWFPPLDAISLYGFLRARKPKTYLEIGSGNSTRFARRAIADGSLPTTIISLDPYPRADISNLSDTIVQMRLEDADLSIFNRVEVGDIVVFDGTHRSFVNSDVTVFFLEVLPNLPPGVLVLVHDIYLPYDYPPGIPFYNEQYVLAAYMEAGDKLELVMPNAYVTRDAELRAPLDRAARASLIPGVEISGCGFWVQTKLSA